MKERGFTLVELIVVIAIIGILAGVILLNYRFSEKQFKLQQAANKLAQDIRLIENRAVAIKKINDQRVVHGIKFVTSSPFSYIFISCELPSEGNIIPSSCQDEDIINIEGKNYISELKNDNVSLDSLTIYFIPPDPKVIFASENQVFGAEKVGILLIYEGSASSKIVSVNRAGLIEIE